MDATDRVRGAGGGRSSGGRGPGRWGWCWRRRSWSGLIGLDQPIVENYVGRQVPTAMVARNLERGSGLLRPRLDTAPLPNYFLVEPPLYECGVVALRRATGLGLEAVGSGALGDGDGRRGLGALRADAAASRPARGAPGRRGLRRLPADDPVRPRLPARRRHARRRRGGPGLLGSVSRVGASRRVGLVRRRVGRCWRWASRSRSSPRSSADPRWCSSWSSRRRRADAASSRPCATLVPALCGMPGPTHLVAAGGGSRASADNRAIWLGLLGPVGPVAVAKPGDWRCGSWSIRAFTPIGAGAGALSGSASAGARTIVGRSGGPGDSSRWPRSRCWRRSCITNTTS